MYNTHSNCQVFLFRMLLFRAFLASQLTTMSLDTKKVALLDYLMKNSSTRKHSRLKYAYFLQQFMLCMHPKLIYIKQYSSSVYTDHGGKDIFWLDYAWLMQYNVDVYVAGF